MRTNLKRTLQKLVNDSALAHYDGSSYYITDSGVIDVERRKLYQMPD